eukprot:Pgem_evm1s3028
MKQKSICLICPREKRKDVFNLTGLESYKLLPIEYYKYMFTKLTQLTEYKYYHKHQVKVKDDCPENFLEIMGIICSIINCGRANGRFQYYMYEERTGRTLNSDLRHVGFIKSRGNSWITLKK